MKGAKCQRIHKKFHKIGNKGWENIDDMKPKLGTFNPRQSL